MRVLKKFPCTNNQVLLPASKSISHRYLMLNKILNCNTNIHNLSDSNDTNVLKNALENINKNYVTKINCEDAGTPYRFLTALCSNIPCNVELFGNDRLQQRPIASLIEALQNIGADIIYSEKDNTFPIIIKGKYLQYDEVTIDASLSSQYLSALMLIACLQNKEVKIYKQGKQSSYSYIHLTKFCLEKYGVLVELNNDFIKVNSTNKICPTELIVESDWSSAAFFYGMLHEQYPKLELNNLSLKSNQGDAVIAQIAEQYFGIKTNINNNNVSISIHGNATKNIIIDIINNPDLAPILMAMACKHNCTLTLHNTDILRHKESDRIISMKNILTQCNCQFIEHPNTIIIDATYSNMPNIVTVDTHNDHRIAMASLTLINEDNGLLIDDIHVVKKSFPNFWQCVSSLGYDFI